MPSMLNTGISLLQCKPSKYQLVPFNDIGLNKDAQYLIKGIIPKQGIVCLYGAPKEGKSFLVLDMAMHIALGWEYRGQKVEQGSVIYCAFEGQAGFANRILAFRQEYLPNHTDFIPFYLLPIRMNLIDEHKAFISAIRSQDVAPSFIVLDTVNRSIPNGNEDGPEFTQYIRAADAISDAFGSTVLIVHHSRLDGERPRGSTVITANVDAQLRVQRNKNGSIDMTVEAAKDLPEDDTFRMALKVVTIGTDVEGDDITSCVVDDELGGKLSSEDRQAESKKSQASAEVAYEILKTLIDNIGLIGSPDDNHVPTDLRYIMTADWRAACVANNTFSAARDKKSRAKTFDRAREKLQADKRINYYGPRVCIEWPYDPTMDAPAWKSP